MRTPPHAVVRQPSGRPGLRGGFGFVLRGARYVYIEHRGLVRFWLPPVLITAVALVAVVHVVLDWREVLVQAVWSDPTGEGWLATLARALHTLLEWLVALVLLVVGGVLVAVGAGMVAAPFNDALSEAVERLETGSEPRPFRFADLVRELGASVRVEAVKSALYLALSTVLLVLSWAVPVVGPPLHVVLGAGLTTLYLALAYVDWPASRRHWTVRMRLKIGLSHGREMLGFGAAVWLLLLIPVLNLLTMPAAVAGGTLLFLELYGPATQAPDV